MTIFSKFPYFDNLFSFKKQEPSPIEIIYCNENNGFVNIKSMEGFNDDSMEADISDREMATILTRNRKSLGKVTIDKKSTRSQCINLNELKSGATSNKHKLDHNDSRWRQDAYSNEDSLEFNKFDDKQSRIHKGSTRRSYLRYKK
ncbi:YBR285W [Saccharomyces arboricola H-6]|uniref:YBR285W n=1 Tax=Saccharomyces arboricola (strain H-6 / AS 2.3317 / CBS 10644) TaxID=1160507 RepID=J8PRG8_SACAR|nr:YBR285W [Saccharomyces arboricola H-6]